MGLAGLSLLLASCSRPGPAPTSTSSGLPPATISNSPTAPATAPLPTEVPQEPLAGQVNGEALTLADYQLELADYQAVTGREADQAGKILVINNLIDQALLAQGAAAQGFSVTEDGLQARLDQLGLAAGSVQALDEWINAHGYTPDSFRRALQRDIAAAWMRDQIAAAVPMTAEQVHARQILLYNLDQANEALGRLQGGKDFTALAQSYDPLRGGDLGWFPKGYLPHPEVEQAAFSLEPGHYSAIIQTPAGYHILYVIERDPQHPLEPDARKVLQTQALQSWLENRRAQSQVEILIP